MLKRSKALILCLMLCIGLLVPFDSKASNLEFYLDYPEPATSESQGYITFLLYNSNTNQYTTNTWFWTTYASTSSAAESPAYGCIENITSRGFEFTIGGVGAASSAYYSLSCYNGSGKCMIYKYSSTERYYHTFSSYVTVCGFKYAGNVGRINYTVDPNTFTVNFNEDGSAILLQGIISALLDIRNLDSSILSTVNSILSSVDGVEGQLSTLTTYLRSTLTSMDSKLSTLLDKADRLIEEQEESNTWLEKIFNWLKDSPEEEKEAASTQGNQSTSDATTAITDNSQGFIDSLGGFANSMSYSGTECAWTFPAITLPAIPGVMDSVQLTSEQPIDFSYWVNQIPSNLLLLIQSLLTLALIIYCFKEVYGTISYVLTLRGGGSE